MHTVIPQAACDIPGKSPENTLKVLTSQTYRRPSGDSQVTNTKNYDLLIKFSFRSNSPCITYLFLLFTETTNVLKGDNREMSMGPSCGASIAGDQMMGSSKDVHKTSVKHAFLNSTHKHIKATLPG